MTDGWSGKALSPKDGGTGQVEVARGDLLLGAGDDQWVRLPGPLTGDGLKLLSFRDGEISWRGTIETSWVRRVREVPAGDVDGMNDTLMLEFEPLPGTTEVYDEGIQQDEGGDNDYTVSGRDIVFATPPAAGHKILVTSVRAATILTRVVRETPTGAADGTNPLFELEFAAVNGTSEVFVGGVQNVYGDDYTISGRFLLFTYPIPIDYKVRVSYTRVLTLTREVGVTPAEGADGERLDFTLPHVPNAGSTEVWVNGVLQDEGEDEDYIMVGNVIVFAEAPQIGYKIRVSYTH